MLEHAEVAATAKLQWIPEKIKGENLSFLNLFFLLHIYIFNAVTIFTLYNLLSLCTYFCVHQLNIICTVLLCFYSMLCYGDNKYNCNIYCTVGLFRLLLYSQHPTVLSQVSILIAPSFCTCKRIFLFLYFRLKYTVHFMSILLWEEEILLLFNKFSFSKWK